MTPVSGVTLPPIFNAYAIASESGWQGTGNHVFGTKHLRLLENVSPDFGQRQAIAGRIKPFSSAGVLDRLKRHAAHAGLLDREVDDPPHLVIVQSLLERHDQRRGQSQSIQPFERLLTDGSEVRTA